MDPISHAASGALLALSLPKRPQAKYFLPLAALVAASPDIDVIFSPAPIDYLLLHRGITHSIFAIPILAPLFALLLYTFWRKSTPNAWSYFNTCIFAASLLLLHIWLDIVTTYGTMIFLPFSDYRVRLNGVFIIDFLLLVPMILSVIYGLRNKKIAILCLMWIFIYPSFCVGLRVLHEQSALKRLVHEDITNIAVLPDAFAPFFWRLVYEENKPFDPNVRGVKEQQNDKSKPSFNFVATSSTVNHQGLNAFGMPRTVVESYPALRQSIEQSLVESSRMAKAYLDFSLMPIEEQRKFETGEEYLISDLRFGTMLPFVQSMMNLRSDGDSPFLLLARRNDNEWTAVRLVLSGAAKDSQWQKPIPPTKAKWWQWVVGTY